MEPSTARWAVVLQGDEWELDEARYLFGSKSEVRVCKAELPRTKRETVLLAREFENLSDAFQVHISAQRILALVNGILFIDDSARSPLRAHSVYGRADDGRWNDGAMYLGPVNAVLGARLRVRDTADAPPHTTWLSSAVSDDVVSDVLTFLRGDPDWFDLYKAFERMRDDINRSLGQGKLQVIGWPATDHFRQSAQVYRHSPSQWPLGYNMTNAMQTSEARVFVQELTRVWLRWRYPVAAPSRSGF